MNNKFGLGLFTAITLGLLTTSCNLNITVNDANSGSNFPNGGVPTVSASGLSVNAGADIDLNMPIGQVSLFAFTTKKGSALGENVVSYQWSKVMGPGTVTFSQARKAGTTASFSKAGAYQLKVEAKFNGETVSDTTVVRLHTPSAPSTPISLQGIVPNERLTDWTKVGIPGGIPNRTTICATVRTSQLAPANPQVTTASGVAGSRSITVSNIADFKVGNGVKIEKGALLWGSYETYLYTVIVSISGNVVTLQDDVTNNFSLTAMSHTDTPLVQKAMDACPEHQVVFLEAGNYRLDGGIHLRSKNVTLRGAGPLHTVLRFQGTSSGVTMGDANGSDYTHSWPDVLVVGSPRKGDVTLEIGDTTPLDTLPNGGIGALCRVALDDDRSLPVVNPWQNKNITYRVQSRSQRCLIKSKTSTTVTLEYPIAFDLPESLNPRFSVARLSGYGMGMESFGIDGTDYKSSGMLLAVNQCIYCYVKSVRGVIAPNYNLFISDAYGLEVKHSFFGNPDDTKQSPNRSAMIFGGSSNCLIENNVFTDQAALMQINQSTNNVFAYNFAYATFNTIGLLINHGPHNSYNLYEGNIGPNLLSDGYHGSASEDTIFRNWFYGAVGLRRWSRNYNIVGNVIGDTAREWILGMHPSLPVETPPDPTSYDWSKGYAYSFGLPYMGNTSWAGVAKPSEGIFWAEWSEFLAGNYTKGPLGFEEADLDVMETTILKGNYNYTDKGINPYESLGGATLPHSMYLTQKPAWFGTLQWPPFNPEASTPNISHQAIPAGFRYHNGFDP